MARVAARTGAFKVKPRPRPTPVSPRAPVPTVSTEITAISVVEGLSSQSATPIISGTSRRSNKGAIYRIRPNGLWDTYWETGEDSPFDMLIEPDPPHRLLGKPAPSFKTVDLDGKPFDLKGELGKNVVMLDFWSTSCGPCLMLMPELEAVAEAFVLHVEAVERPARPVRLPTAPRRRRTCRRSTSPGLTSVQAP